MSKTPERWPIRLTHEKCKSDVNTFALDISVERTGMLVITCACIECDEEFELQKGILEVVAEALLAERAGRVVPRPRKELPFPRKPN